MVILGENPSQLSIHKPKFSIHKPNKMLDARSGCCRVGLTDPLYFFFFSHSSFTPLIHKP
ncbi:hypothetical protein HanPSC8_Chr02g0059611 [Helianthus annuus]|nr:hypothetical protein HanPSC8_Chr02g0059611 [Helianthus annuus]